jgi:hypothetical protein
VIGASGVPYFSQWESADLVPQFIDGSLSSAADPRWAESGATTPADYGFWAPKACGLACLRMILSSHGLPVPPTMRLVDLAVAWKAYIPVGDRVNGLIYRPFAEWVRHDFGVVAEVVPDLTVERLTSVATPGTPVIASVHHWIRWPDRHPPETGGHLVLVTGAARGLVRLHNPSGLPGVSQQDAVVETAAFARFFAGRGMVIGPRQRTATAAQPDPEHALERGTAR